MINLLRRCHVFVNSVLCGVENGDLDLVTLDREVEVNIILNLIKLNELALAILVEADKRSVFEVEVASFNLCLLTCSDLCDFVLSARESFDSVQVPL